MAILSGPEIISAVHREDIHITPFELGLVNPASIDLRLGDEVAVYSDWVDCSAENYHRTVVHGLDVANLVHFDGAGLVGHSYVQDIKKPARLHTFKMDKKTGWVLKPGILYLMHTLESVCTERFVPVLDGKSSIGRLGITIHLTAGFGDPGYDGQYTLEVTTVHCIRIYPGMRFCQMRFHEMVGSFMDYQKVGHYKGEASRGAVASAVHKQFET